MYLMWNRRSRSFRYLPVYAGFGLFLIVIHYIIRSRLPSINSSHDKTPFSPLHNDIHIFDKAFRRLLHTHDIAYNGPSTTCQSGENLSPKDQKTLDSVARLLPELRTKILPYPHEYFKGRGIVLTVGPSQLLHTRLNLRIIEWTRTKLPVEVWYSSAQITKDVANDLLSSVPTLNVKACCFETFRCHSPKGNEIKVKANYVHAPRAKNIHGKIYTFKPAAIVSSTFAEVIFLDSDCYVVRDPNDLFDKDPMYKVFGVLFYPDIYMSHQRPQLWSLLNTTCVRNEFSVDSGVLLFDKKRVWNGLYMTKLMSDHHEVFYDHFISNGDKDTFRLAFRYMKIPYYIVGIPCSTGYTPGRTFCGVTLCKTDSLGLNVYFDHVHHPKHLHDLTFLKKNFTHTMIALADPNTQSFIYGYCGLYPLPCFQVGFYDHTSPVSLNTHCSNSAFLHTEKPLVEISPGQSVLWNPNLETKLLLMKKTEQTMAGFIDFYFQTQSEKIFKNVKL